jgi:hypothetical protein
MPNQLATFDPIGSAARGFATGQAIQGQRKQNQLADFQMEQAKVGAERQSTLQGREDAVIKGKFLVNTFQALKGLPLEQRSQAAQSLLPQAQQIGIDVSKIDLSQPLTDEVLDRGTMESATLLQALQTGGQGTIKQRDRDALLRDLSSKDETVSKSASIALGLTPRAVGSSGQTIAAQGTTDEVAAVESTIAQEVAGAKVTGAAKAKAKSAPLIAKTESFIKSEVKLAEAAAKERGELLTDLARAEAALPGLTNAIDQLRELAPIATSTLGGKVWDAAVKETGFGSTKGADARAKWIAIVNNQVLPLLKPTFGAAFTVQEGESLKATMGDPDASPGQKLEQLDAFIAQKLRDIDTKKQQLAPQDAEAVEWARANPNDPRSAMILQKNGVQ